MNSTVPSKYAPAKVILHFSSVILKLFSIDDSIKLLFLPKIYLFIYLKDRTIYILFVNNKIIIHPMSINKNVQ